MSFRNSDPNRGTRRSLRGHRELLEGKWQVGAQLRGGVTRLKDKGGVGFTGPVRLVDHDVGDLPCVRLVSVSEQFVFVSDGDKDQEVRFVMPCLRGGWILTGKREGRVNGLCSLISGCEIAADEDVQLGLRGNLRGCHVFRCSL